MNSFPVPDLWYRDLTEDQSRSLAAKFSAAKPFPHIEIKHALRSNPDQVSPAFPPPEWPAWSRFRDVYQHQKMFNNEIEQIPWTLRCIVHELCSPPFLQFLEHLTGIEALIPDPYLDGGGLHCSGPGGVLAPHTDFHLYKRLRLYRRINVLLYLNPEWKQEYGGCLELYQKGNPEPALTVVPEWGTCVIFKTDDDSVHGFSKPIVGERWRRSIALYYYTSAETAKFSGDTTTHWRQHGDLSGLALAQLQIYKSLIFCSRVFSYFAHKANPHLASKFGMAPAKPPHHDP